MTVIVACLLSPSTCSGLSKALSCGEAYISPEMVLVSARVPA
ncbi:hypothetical protein [Pasteurella sp. PK-2025]